MKVVISDKDFTVKSSRAWSHSPVRIPSLSHVTSRCSVLSVWKRQMIKEAAGNSFLKTIRSEQSSRIPLQQRSMIIITEI